MKTTVYYLGTCYHQRCGKRFKEPATFPQERYFSSSKKKSRIQKSLDDWLVRSDWCSPARLST